MYQEHSVQPASTREVAAGLTSGLPQLLPGLACWEALNCTRLLCTNGTTTACRQHMQAFERLVADLWS